MADPGLRKAVQDAILAPRGTLVASRRQDLGLSQAALSRALDPPCDQSTISGIERGEQDMSIWLAARLAPVLGLSLHELLIGQIQEVAIS